MPAYKSNGKWVNFWHYVWPRPLSLLANGLHFWGGVFLTLIAGNVSQSFWFIVLWFLIQEGFVQQAKYMWNDVRDQARDRHLPANRQRLVARKPVTAVTYTILMLRWAGGLVLGWWLSPLCFALLLIISTLQVIYERWGKSYAERYPLLPLLIVGLGAGCKFGGGLLAAGWSPKTLSFWLLIVGMFGIGIGYGATLWRVEADYLHVRKLNWRRGQSAYFWKNGRFWLYAGTLISLLAGICLLILGWVGGETAVVAILFIAATLVLHRLHAHTDYQQFNWLYAGQNWPLFRQIVHDQPFAIAKPAYWIVLLQLALHLNSSCFQYNLQQLIAHKSIISNSDLR